MGNGSARFNRRRLVVGGTCLVGAAAAAVALRSRSFGPSDLRPILAAEEPDGPFLRFLVIGDSGFDTKVRERVVAGMVAEARERPPRFVVMAGDNVYPDGVSGVDDPAWETHFVRPFAELDVPFRPCLGNHDHGLDPSAQVAYSKVDPKWRMPAAWYSFRERVAEGCDAELFVLDSTTLRDAGMSFFEAPEQVRWLEERLRASDATWKILVTHHPLYSLAGRGGSSTLRWHLGDLLAETGVSLVISGHEHHSELVDPRSGWVQVISGAGSAPREIERNDRSVHAKEGGGFARITLRPDGGEVRFFATDVGESTAYPIPLRTTASSS